MAQDIASTAMMLLNDGCRTFFRSRGAGSVLNLMLESANMNVCWSLDLDTGGRDDHPIPLDILQFGKAPRRVHGVTNWDLYTWLLNYFSPSEDIIAILPRCIGEASPVAPLPISLPSVDKNIFIPFCCYSPC